jgi:hypothetical protein
MLLFNLTGVMISIWLALVSGACIFSAVYVTIQTMASRKPGVPLFQNPWRLNPWGGYDASDLTEEGQRAQEKYWVSLIGAVFCGILSVILGALAGGFRRVS